MFKTKIRKDGHSASIAMSSEVLATLGVKEGDTVRVTQSGGNGLKIHGRRPEALEHLKGVLLK
jgi:antitoxin component of MazEF toxin-antitoxin module